MLANMMFYGVVDDPKDQQDDTYFSFSLQQFIVGVESALITIPINALLVYLFRNIAPRPLRTETKTVSRQSTYANGSVTSYFSTISHLDIDVTVAPHARDRPEYLELATVHGEVATVNGSQKTKRKIQKDVLASVDDVTTHGPVYPGATGATTDRQGVPAGDEMDVEKGSSLHSFYSLPEFFMTEVSDVILQSNSHFIPNLSFTYSLVRCVGLSMSSGCYWL